MSLLAISVVYFLLTYLHLSRLPLLRLVNDTDFLDRDTDRNTIEKTGYRNTDTDTPLKRDRDHDHIPIPITFLKALLCCRKFVLLNFKKQNKVNCTIQLDITIALEKD